MIKVPIIRRRNPVAPSAPTNSSARSMAPVRPTHPIVATAPKTEGPDTLRFVPLGGLEEIGRNCSFFEYKNEIVVIDVGIQFPEEETPGVDYIIPNVAYLEQKKANVKAILLTHGHYDHIHALPYLYDKMGSPTIYTAAFTRHLIERRFSEFPNVSKPKFIVVKNNDKIKVSENFTVEFFDISHTIPDALGVCIDTPAGKMVNFGDFRLDTNQAGEPINLETFERLGKMNIHSVFMDSTNSIKEGFSLSEKNIEENLEKLFKNAKGRIIVGTFASLMTRISEILKIADRLGRKVALNGRSMKDNVQIAMNTGYIKTRKDQIIPIEEINKHKDDKVMILTTGAQGEPNAGLMKIVTGEHKNVALKPTDTVIFSSSVVPGNERSVQALQDNVARQVDEIYNSKLLDIHASGHAHSEDLKLVIKLVKPKFVVPVHAYYFMRKHTAKLAQSVGIPKENTMMMDNGQVALITKDSFTITKEEVPAFYVMVDGLGVGDVEEVVLRDRRMLSQEGMIVVILTMDRQHGKVLKNPDIISRGFILLKENQEMLNEIRRKIRSIAGRVPGNQSIETDYLKTLIRDQIGQFLYTKTKRRPMIIPVIIEI
ncbi:MAG: ribonuclease J [Parcubacteria group bacterium Gr01-1014_19]|nr:MAG: ribonuclease J [Parcubacteria group bacterium Gr01-1014_19]